jgi:succinylglutamate desuccinylase
VIIGGLHGNEPAGIVAAERVMSELDPLAPVLRGRVVALAGNRRALASAVRYVDRDLNRGWRSGELERLRSKGELTAEDDEQRELADLILTFEREEGQLIFLDLHTTSGPTEPFACFSDTQENRSVACSLPVNVVLGLERALHGTLLGWATARGHVGVSFEAGQHQDPLAPRRHEAAIWMYLVGCGAVDARDVPDEPEHDALFGAATARPRIVEVRHRHLVEEGDEFQMERGFRGFDPIRAGQVVARDRTGPIRAPEGGLMLMPRYQGQGEDGFFVTREIACSSTWVR